MKQGEMVLVHLTDAHLADLHGNRLSPMPAIIVTVWENEFPTHPVCTQGVNVRVFTDTNDSPLWLTSLPMKFDGIVEMYGDECCTFEPMNDGLIHKSGRMGAIGDIPTFHSNEAIDTTSSQNIQHEAQVKELVRERDVFAAEVKHLSDQITVLSDFLFESCIADSIGLHGGAVGEAIFQMGNMKKSLSKHSNESIDTPYEIKSKGWGIEVGDNTQYGVVVYICGDAIIFDKTPTLVQYLPSFTSPPAKID